MENDMRANRHVRKAFLTRGGMLFMLAMGLLALALCTLIPPRQARAACNAPDGTEISIAIDGPTNLCAGDSRTYSLRMTPYEIPGTATWYADGVYLSVPQNSQGSSVTATALDDGGGYIAVGFIPNSLDSGECATQLTVRVDCCPISTNRYCVSDGVITGGVQSVPMCYDCSMGHMEVVFLADAADEGGTQAVVIAYGGGAQACPPTTNGFVRVATNVSYTWTINGPASLTAAGTGPRASIATTNAGRYTVRYKVNAIRDCTPPEIELLATTDVIRVEIAGPTQLCARCTNDCNGPFTLVDSHAPSGVTWTLATLSGTGDAGLTNETLTSVQLAPGTNGATYEITATSRDKAECMAKYTTTVWRVGPIEIVKGTENDEITRVMPGEPATLKVGVQPTTRTLVWSIVATNKTDDIGPLASINAATGELKFEVGSGYGDVTVRAALAGFEECYDEATIKVECGSCGIDPCNGECASRAGSLRLTLGSINAEFSLGKVDGGAWAGSLAIRAEAPSPNLATPAGLSLLTISGVLDPVCDAQRNLRQVMAPECLADIATNSPFSYTISFHHAADVWGKDPLTGLYLLASTNAFVTYLVENPAASTNDCDTLRIVRQVTGKAVTNEFSWSETSGWTLSRGNGLRIESLAGIESGADRILTHRVSDATGERPVVKKLTRRAFSFGERLVQSVIDPDGLALTNSYAYYTNGVNAGRLKEATEPDGAWTRYEYDGQGRLALTERCWGDGGTSAVARSYSPVETNKDMGTFLADSPRVVTESINGLVTRRTFHAYWIEGNGEGREVVEEAATPTAAYGDAGNRRTERDYVFNGADAPVFGPLKAVRHPDGRVDTYSYQRGNYVTGADPASNRFVETAGGTYKQTTVVHGTAEHPDGLALKTTEDRNVADRYGQVVLSEQYVHTEGDPVRIRWTAYELDVFGNPIDVRHSDGTSEQAQWDCCGKSLEVDAHGLVRQFFYDDLRRMTRQIVNTDPPQFTDWLNPTPNQCAFGTTAISSGGMTNRTSRQHDPAGRVTNEVDAAGLTTCHTYEQGGLVVTTRLPGDGERVTTHYLDGRAKSVTGSAVVPQYYVHGVEADGTQWTEVFTGPTGTGSLSKVRTVTDMLGRTIREERPAYGAGTVTNRYFHDQYGRLERATAPGAADTVYAYDELGRQSRQGRVENGVTNWLSGSEQQFELPEANGPVWQISRSLVFPVDNATAVTTSVQRVRLTGLSSNLTSETESIDARNNKTLARTSVDRGARTVVQTVDYPDSTNAAVTVTSNGLLRFSISKTGARTDYAYDPLERQTNVETRTGSPERSRRVGLTTHYNDKGQVAWTEDAASNRTWFAYDPESGRRIAVTNALGNVTSTHYDMQGRVVGTWGATYPVFYEYDTLGRMSAMYTLRSNSVTIASYDDFLSNSNNFDKTTWLYEQATGLLTNKLYADGTGPTYAYTPEGKLATRVWARGVISEYAYASCCGALTNIMYSDATPSVRFTLDRLGRQVTVVDGSGTRAFTYNDALQLAAETNVDGTITRQYDSLGRNAGLTQENAASVHYSHSEVGRLNSISSVVGEQSNGWVYSYLPGSELLTGWTPVGSGTAFSRAYEANRDLLTGVTNLAGGLLVSAFDYQNDALGRRRQRTDSGAAVATNLFAYDALSQLTNALLNGSSFAWAFDPIGNRVSESSNSVSHGYAANALNQYTSVTNGGTRTLLYDPDGNLTNDSVFGFSWDAENRLVGVSNGSITAAYKYDYMSRRFEKTVNGVTHTFLYDGWNLIQERITDNGSPITNSYIWGLDLSGLLQGAGGIGGLLTVVRNGTPYYPCYDANGNITEYVDRDGTVVAHREYDAYGGTLVSSGPMKDAFSFWFSSKYLDAETGLLYYGYRYYAPGMGRWLSRDPIEEDGGLNLCAFLGNNPGNLLDYLGLYPPIIIIPLPGLPAPSPAPIPSPDLAVPMESLTGAISPYRTKSLSCRCGKLDLEYAIDASRDQNAPPDTGDTRMTGVAVKSAWNVGKEDCCPKLDKIGAKQFYKNLLGFWVKDGYSGDYSTHPFPVSTPAPGRYIFPDYPSFLLSWLWRSNSRSFRTYFVDKSNGDAVLATVWWEYETHWNGPGTTPTTSASFQAWCGDPENPVY
jgi:RHS repeat-associated protein